MATTVKENVIEMISRMPEDATVTDIMAELFVRQKIDIGLQQLDGSRSHPSWGASAAAAERIAKATKT